MMLPEQKNNTTGKNMRNTQKSLRARLVPDQLIGTRAGLFHLLLTPKGEAMSHPTQQDTAVLRAPSGSLKHERDQSLQTDDFIFRD